MASADLALLEAAHKAGRIRVVVINDTYRSAPWADALYACDPPWWDGARGAPDFAGQKWTQDPAAARRWGLKYVKGRSRPGLSLDPSEIHYGGNSGYQAINLVSHFVGKGGRIILLGYDMQAGADGRRHHHDTEPARVMPNFRRWVESLATLLPGLERAGVEVVNCTRRTAIPASTFRRADLAEELAR